MVIYKYFTLNNAIKCLASNGLIFSAVKSYNDPFEGANITARYFGKSNIGDNGPSLFDDNHIPEGGELVREQKSKYENAIACCFSRTNSDLLLWSHYGEFHRGIVIAFETDALFGDIQKDVILESAANILYCNDVSEISGELYHALNVKVKETFLRKAKCWSYEEEVRYLFANDNSLFPRLDGFNDKFVVKFPSNAIRAIFCGVASYYNIGDLLNAYLMAKGIDAHVYRMMKSETEYKILQGKSLGKFATSRRDVEFKIRELEKTGESADRIKSLIEILGTVNLTGISM